MTGQEFADMIGYLESHWGTLHKGWVGQEAALYTDFSVYPGSMAAEVVRGLFYDGSNACPGPSKVIARLRERTSVLGATAGVTDSQYCGDQHKWAFLHTVAGKREAMCVICHTEKTFDEEDLRTSTERADDPSEPPADITY